MLITQYMLIAAFLIQVSRSEEECLISECGQALEVCSSSDICSEALSQVYDVCAQVEDCTDKQYVNTEICGLNKQCTKQIVKIASCFIDNCSDEDTEQQIEEAEELIGQQSPQEEEQECFENSCVSELELCVANPKCNKVLHGAKQICSGDGYKCLNEHFVENYACNGYDGCSDLVLATAKCFYQNCNDECINVNCHEALTDCINSESCNQGLELAYSGYCEQINCLDHDAQLNILCNGDVTGADYFNVLATCYYDNCFNEEIEEEHNDYKGYGSAECIAESGYHGFFDEYGNCCAGLDRIDCLWNKQDSHCGWFYDNQTEYCYGWQGADTCASFQQNSITALPMSCNFEDCFMDSCHGIVAECKDNEDCAIALNKYIYENANDYTLCGNSEQCIQIFDQIVDCLNDNCATEQPPTEQPLRSFAPSTSPSTAPSPPAPPTWENLECPAGSTQIGGINYDIIGCGITPCNERFDIATIEDCRDKCQSYSDCLSFSWAPVEGDQNHPASAVCTIYNTAESNMVWGPYQILCGMNPATRAPLTTAPQTTADLEVEENKILVADKAIN